MLGHAIGVRGEAMCVHDEEEERAGEADWWGREEKGAYHFARRTGPREKGERRRWAAGKRRSGPAGLGFSLDFIS